MSEKGERNQKLQEGKAEKAYKGYLPSVMGKSRPDMDEPITEKDLEHRTGRVLNTPS